VVQEPDHLVTGKDPSWHQLSLQNFTGNTG
jgi:hypothetical protein